MREISLIKNKKKKTADEEEITVRGKFKIGLIKNICIPSKKKKRNYVSVFIQYIQYIGMYCIVCTGGTHAY